jgi:hypothetical protein
VAAAPPAAQVRDSKLARCLVLASPLSVTAFGLGFTSSVLMFGPERNDALVIAWVSAIWLSAILVQTVLLEHILRAWRRRARPCLPQSLRLQLCRRPGR